MRTAMTHPVRLTDGQAALVADDGPWARACRDVWNAALEERLGALDAARGRKMPHGWWPTFASQCRDLTAAKLDAPWLTLPPNCVLQQTLRDLDWTWASWLFQRVSGKPRWRAKKRSARNRWVPSYRFPDRERFRIRRVSRGWGQVRLPKLGWVRFRWTRDVPEGGVVTSVTLKQDRVGDWHVAFAIALPDVQVTHSRPGTAAGVDRGVVVAAATSDGELLDGGPTLTAGEAGRLLRLERRKARQRKGSRNYVKTRRAIAKLRRRQARRRADHAHKTSHHLTARYETIVVEALNVTAMTRSAKGTVDRPGRHVSQKRGLNRAVRDKSWGALRSCLAYKTARAGGRLIEVNAAYTSQTCHACGHIDATSRENQARWVCVACDHQCHADVNAARNILTRAVGSTTAGGRPVAACGDLAHQGGSAKQEPAQHVGSPQAAA